LKPPPEIIVIWAKGKPELTEENFGRESIPRQITYIISGKAESGGSFFGSILGEARMEQTCSLG